MSEISILSSVMEKLYLPGQKKIDQEAKELIAQANEQNAHLKNLTSLIGEIIAKENDKKIDFSLSGDKCATIDYLRKEGYLAEKKDKYTFLGKEITSLKLVSQSAADSLPQKTNMIYAKFQSLTNDSYEINKIMKYMIDEQNRLIQIINARSKVTH